MTKPTKRAGKLKVSFQTMQAWNRGCRKVQMNNLLFAHNFSHVFMNNVDKRILDFHLANLEYAIGAPLDKVALKDWDLDDPHGFAGSHMAGKIYLNLKQNDKNI